MALELAQAGLSLVNPAAAGLASVALTAGGGAAHAAARYRSAVSGILGGGHSKSETLGKTLSHHQVIHAVNQIRTSNNPRVDIGKAILSSVGGNPRKVNQSVVPNSRTTLKISPHDAKSVLREGLSDHPKYTPASRSLISY